MGSCRQTLPKELLPLGELVAFVTDKRGRKDVNYFDGADVYCVVLDVQIYEDANGEGIFHLMCQSRTPNFTSWDRGRFDSQVSVFASLLDHDGQTVLNLFDGRGAGVRIDGKAKGRGWRHYHSRRPGFGHEETSHFTGCGRMKVALALPYIGHGYHGGVPVWAGFISDWYAQDTRALTTQRSG